MDRDRLADVDTFEAAHVLSRRLTEPMRLRKVVHAARRSRCGGGCLLASVTYGIELVVLPGQRVARRGFWGAIADTIAVVGANSAEGLTPYGCLVPPRITTPVVLRRVDAARRTIPAQCQVEGSPSPQAVGSD